MVTISGNECAMIRDHRKADTEDRFPFERGCEGLGGRGSGIWQDGTGADNGQETNSRRNKFMRVNCKVVRWNR